MRKFLTVVGVLFLVYFVVTNPTGAAHAAKSIGAGILSVGAGLSAFLAAATS